MDKIKEAAEKFKEKIAKNPLEKALNEATSDVNWNAPNKVLQEIADHTYSFNDFSEVMKHIWKKLGSERKNWRRILKALTLIDFLIRNGAPRCVQEFRDEIYQIRTLQDFSHYEEGQDRGAAIRETSKRIVQLLNDEQKIDEERKKAQEMRERIGDMRGFGSGESRGGSNVSSNRYGGYSSKDTKKMEGFGSDTGFGWQAEKRYDDTKRIRDWRVEKSEETSNNRTRDDRDEDDYVTRTGTKYDATPSNKETELDPSFDDKPKERLKPSVSGGTKLLPPPKGGKTPVGQQEVVDLFEVDAPTNTTSTPSKTPTTTGNQPNNVFTWDNTQPQPQPQPQAKPQAPNNQWNWGQPVNTNQAATPPITQNTQVFNWGQPQQNASQPPQSNAGNNIQNLYQQSPNKMVGGQNAFGFGNVPQTMNPQQQMNNLGSQLNQISFTNNTAPVNNSFGIQNNIQQVRPNNVTASPQQNVNNKHDGFDDFQTAKPTPANEYKNYTQAEKSIIDLSDITNETNKKKDQKEKTPAAKNTTEGILYSSKEDLDNFFVSPQPVIGMNNMSGPMGMNMAYNQGMIPNQGMRNMGGMTQQMGMYPAGGMQMGGVSPIGGMQQMGGMQMGMNMGFQNMGGMAPNMGFNPMMGGNVQGNFGNPGMGQMNGMNPGYGFR